MSPRACVARNGEPRSAACWSGNDQEPPHRQPVSITELAGEFDRLGLGYQQSESEVVEDDFSALNVQSRSRTARVSLTQPLFWTPLRQIDVGIAGDYRDSESSVAGTEICLQQDVLDCTPSLAVLRFEANALWRGTSDVVALRSTLSWGIDALGATRVSSHRIPDGRFAAWLGQAQWVSPWRWLSGGIFWGARLTNADRANEGLQRDGIHFALEARYPEL